MEIGYRVIFDQDGEIILIQAEVEGEVLPRKEITELNFVDIDYNTINHQTHRIIGIDVETKQPILEEIPQIITPEQQQIKDLEDALLLATDSETGGIL